MEEILDFFKMSIIVFLLFLILIGVPFTISLGIKYIIGSYRCSHSYDDTKYDLLLGCKVNYNGKYILEKLYIKTFEQNIIIKKK